jgi:cysteine-rich repeat protein
VNATSDTDDGTATEPDDDDDDDDTTTSFTTDDTYDTTTFPQTTTTFPETTIGPSTETTGTDTFFTTGTESGGFCGDNIIDFGEDCDDGDFDDNDGCLSTCELASCGDGIHWFGVEQCDDGNFENEDACRNDCTLPFCGDGVVDVGEDCDDGDLNDNDECVSGCVFAECGDGNVWTGVEECDDGNQDDDDTCRNDCTLPLCGDGDIDDGEECDDANDDEGDACLSSCQDAECGDGFLWTGMEECDDGDANGEAADCTPVCTANICGDGFQHATNEECDPGADNIGPGLECRDGCVLNVCGDGDAWAAEECDDGNADDTDACIDCNDAECGDGFVFAGTEDCDDQDANDLDRCHDDCSWHRVTQLALGGNHTCALFDSQLVKCWGNANHGRTGAGNITNLGDDEPASAGAFLDVEDPVQSIVAAVGHTCVVHPDFSVRCFGRNTEGQLGNGDVEHIGDTELPSAVGPIPLGGPVANLGTRGGAFHTCAWMASGEALCWGRFSNAVLGIPGLAENIGDTEPASAGGPVDIGGTVVAFAPGAEHTCALLDNGAVRCWGDAVDAPLGYGNSSVIGDNEAPSAAGDVPLGGTAVQLTAGWFHTCAVLDGGTLRCWGRGTDGRLGYGNVAWVGALNTPQSVGDVSVGGTVVSVAAGVGHTCALLDDATVVCWGFGLHGQLGYAATASVGDDELPSTAGPVAVGAPVVQLAADGHHTCAITDSGAVRCWGHAGDGRLGYGNVNFVGDDETPATVGDVPLLPP